MRTISCGCYLRLTRRAYTSHENDDLKEFFQLDISMALGYCLEESVKVLGDQLAGHHFYTDGRYLIIKSLCFDLPMSTTP
jgi:hypothetical protein